MKRSGALLGCLGLLAVGVVIFLMWGVGTRNSLVTAETKVDAQWAQVESAYQRRFDLIPNLVRTVQGAANFEKSTLEAVVNARARVGQVAAPGGFTPDATGGPTNDPAALANFEQAQAGLSSALSRLLVVVERYPDLKSNQNFLDLQAELAGTENRIGVERRRYNEEAQKYNAAIKQFPANLIANFSGLKPKAYFKGVAGSEKPPEVNFDFSNTAAGTAR
jgi:LemA protein